jgi:hypothetical protein
VRGREVERGWVVEGRGAVGAGVRVEGGREVEAQVRGRVEASCGGKKQI